MIITLDDEMTELVNALKWADWNQTFTIAIQRNANRTRGYALVVGDELEEAFTSVSFIVFNHWSIADLIIDLVISVAGGFRMSPGNTSQQYVLALLEAIRKHQADGQNIVWTGWDEHAYGEHEISPGANAARPILPRATRNTATEDGESTSGC